MQKQKNIHHRQKQDLKAECCVKVHKELVDLIWEKHPDIYWGWDDLNQQKVLPFKNIILTTINIFNGDENIRNEFFSFRKAKIKMVQSNLWPFNFSDKSKRLQFRTYKPIYDKIADFKKQHNFTTITMAVDFIFLFWYYIYLQIEDPEKELEHWQQSKQYWEKQRKEEFDAGKNKIWWSKGRKFN